MKLVDFMLTGHSYNHRGLCLVSGNLLFWSAFVVPETEPKALFMMGKCFTFELISSPLNITIILIHLFILLTFTDGLL